jgi:FHA domain
VSKLVLFLADDTTLDVPLDRERITIGRRVSNDVCLPNLGVSGEHAAVVTILADSFLEDLNSTNGTLVNGNAIAKHFLRDHDEIDIGRHKLIYCVDDNAEFPSKSLEGPARVMERDSGGRVEAAKPPVKRRKAGAAPTPEAREHSAGRGKPASKPRPPPIEPLIEPPEPPPDDEPDVVETAPPPAAIDGPAIRILTGVRMGHVIALMKAETTLGRPGVQVASILKTDTGFRLKPLEGISPPSVNGQPIGSEGAELAPGDVIDIAGGRVEFVDPTAVADAANQAA